ncbi:MULTISPECIES: hypothetical protein [Helicobacter]|uniref:Uncharacterized protein n=1 Tax=Helicobacter ganmani TaxID=60246 RepID=A0A3D8IC60_9HELI|nr:MULTISPECIES: hypothetical protein [Helicobacter]RDU62749.1 hypothetical protein CQA43_05800 [Helicobacter ganmani]
MLWAILSAILGLILIPLILFLKAIVPLLFIVIFGLSPYALVAVLGFIGLWLIFSYHNAKDS